MYSELVIMLSRFQIFIYMFFSVPFIVYNYVLSVVVCLVFGFDFIIDFSCEN